MKSSVKSLITTLIALILPMAASAADTATPKTAHPMKIGIIGTGDIGGALARHWGAAGHQLLISSRHPEQLQSLAKEIGPNVKVGTPKEAAAFGDVVLVSVPYHATAQVGRDYAAELKGKVVLDTGNPYPSRDGDMAVRDRQRGTGVASAEYLPGTRLVRAFNAINAGPLLARSLPQARAHRHSARRRRCRRDEDRRAARERRRFRSRARGQTLARARVRLRHARLRARHDRRRIAQGTQAQIGRGLSTTFVFQPS